MAGFDLKEGQYDGRNVSDDELWSALSCVFSSRSRNDSSYKFGFLKSIIDNLYNVDMNLKLSFDQLFSKFTEIYWNLIFKYGIRQKAPTNDNRETYLEQVLHATVAKYGIVEEVPYESLSNSIMIDISHKVKMKCKTYVVGALYGDTNRLFYSFSKKEEWIKINPLMYEFICKHKTIIEKLNYYDWAKFLEKVNSDSTVIHLLDKLDESSKRNNLSIYRQILFNEFESKTCFYCGKKITTRCVEVDHFIPWSYIKDDNLWNLVLACSECNRCKSDKLPDIIYLNSLVKRNDDILVKCNRSDMMNYRSDRLKYIYYWAQMNGYDRIWRPKKLCMAMNKTEKYYNDNTKNYHDKK